MPKQISTLRELRNEIALLETQKALQEEQLRGRLKKLTVDLRPSNLIRYAFRSLRQDSNLKKDVALKSTEAVIGFLMSNILFKNFGFAARTVASIVGTSLATGILGEQAEKYIAKFKVLVEKFRNSGKDPKDLFEEQDI